MDHERLAKAEGMQMAGLAMLQSVATIQGGMMGFRFRRSFGLLPGIRINLGKRGISATVGVRGAGLTLGTGSAHLNLGLPGSGLSYRTRLDAPPRRPGRTEAITPGKPPPPQADVPESQPTTDLGPSAQIIEFKSVDVASLGSDSLSRVSALLDKLKHQRSGVSLEIMQAEKDATRAKNMAASLAWLRRWTAPAALAARREYAEDCADRLDVLKEIKDSLVLNVEFDINDESKKRFFDVVSAFDRVSRCARIWDVTAAQGVDRARTRSAASQALDMRPVSFSRSHDGIMATDFKPPIFINDNGADLLFYPAFVAAQVAGRSALLDIREIEIRAEPVTFVVSDGTVPSDAQVVGNTWRYVNKNGQPDQRFSDNPSIPLARYCKIFFQGAGLNEAWMLSNAEYGIAFGEAILKYKASLKTTESEAEGIAPPSADEWPAPELPEKVPPPVRDWKTPSVLYGSFTAVAAVALIVVWLLNPQLLSSIPVFVEQSPASPRVMAVSPGTRDAKTEPTPPVSQTTAVPPPPLVTAEIAELQQLLKRAGFDPGPADGRAGTRTRQALTDWAKNRGIRNPQVDRPTLETLRQKAGTSAR